MIKLIKNLSPFNNRTEMPMIVYVIKIILVFLVCKFAGELIAEGIVILIHFAVGKNPLKGEMFAPEIITLIIYYGYIIVIGITLLYWKLFQKKAMSEMGLTKRFGSYFVGAAAGALLVGVCVLAVMLTGTVKYHGIFKNIDFGAIVLMLGGFIIQGATEEILCRGVVLFSLKDKAPIPAAIGVSTLVFVIPHLMTLSEGKPVFVIIGVLDLILISVVFSLLTLRFNSIWAACGLHCVWNFVLFSILGLNLSGNDETAAAIFDLRSVGKNILNGGDYGIEASIVTAAVLAAAGLILFLSRKKAQNG
jgi:membrane protease YdiL (CAAX protease family)